MSYYSGIDTSETILAGVAPAMLQQWLAAAQQAYHDLMTGGKPVVVSYSQGEGNSKTVTYTRAEGPQLMMYIKQLQAQLGIIPGRRPVRIVFRGR